MLQTLISKQLGRCQTWNQFKIFTNHWTLKWPIVTQEYPSNFVQCTLIFQPKQTHVTAKGGRHFSGSFWCARSGPTSANFSGVCPTYFGQDEIVFAGTGAASAPTLHVQPSPKSQFLLPENHTTLLLHSIWGLPAGNGKVNQISPTWPLPPQWKH